MRGSSSALASLAAALIGACSSSGSGNATDAGMTTTTILVGTPCKATSECGTDPRASCSSEGEGYPGGYCSLEPCDATQHCPAGATCVSIGSETPACFKGCAKDSDCRTAEGYVCQLFVITPPDGFGPTDHACAFPCKRDPECK